MLYFGCTCRAACLACLNLREVPLTPPQILVSCFAVQVFFFVSLVVDLSSEFFSLSVVVVSPCLPLLLFPGPWYRGFSWQAASFQLLEYQMVMAEGQICYSREIGLCPPCTEATPSAEGGYPL